MYIATAPEIVFGDPQLKAAPYPMLTRLPAGNSGLPRRAPPGPTPAEEALHDPPRGGKRLAVIAVCERRCSDEQGILIRKEVHDSEPLSKLAVDAVR